MAKKKNSKKDAAKKKPQVHEDLEGYEITIDEFGQIQSTMNREQLNKFLNKNVPDKKFKDRDDLDHLNLKKAEEDAGEEDTNDIDPSELPDDPKLSDLDKDKSE